MLDGSRSRRGLRQLAVLLLPSLVTLPRFRNGFVFDDLFVIQRGEFIHRLGNLPRAFMEHTMVASSLHEAVGRPSMDTYRPLSIASFFWDAALSGREPWSYHLTNLILHALACLLVLELLDVLLPRVESSVRLCAALWFALSPWLCEAHVFINGRSDLLLACFVITALLLQRSALDRQRPRLALLAGASLWLALLSKEIAIVLAPFVAAVPCARALPWRERATRAWPLGAALCLYFSMRLGALSGLRSHSDAAQLALALRQLPLLLVDGLSHVVVPTPYFLRSLRDDYAGAGPLAIAACSALVLALGALALASYRRTPVVTWALLFSLTALAPATMISTVLWPGFGRYLYVPAAGLSLLWAAALDLLARRTAFMRKLALSLGALLAAVAGALLLLATLDFESERTLYERSIAQRPEQAWTYGFLGMSLRRDAQCAEALAYLTRAAQLDAGEPRYATHLGRCLVDLGSYPAALDLARRGRERFAGARSEAGFLLIEALALPASHAAEQAWLLERCLQVDRARSDCAALLSAVRAASQATPSAAGADQLP
jgi:protein O-mannosyl-transferase